MKLDKITVFAVLAPILASTAFVVELTGMPLLLPLIRDDFGLGLDDLGTVFNSYSFAVGISVLCAGYWGAKWGIDHLFRLGVALFLVGGMMVVFSSTYQALLIGRTLQGFGGGIFSPLVPVLLTQAVSKRPGRILVIWGSLSGFVAAAVPFFAGMAVELAGWEVVYAITVILAMLAIMFGAIARPNGQENSASHPFEIRDLFADVRILYAYSYIFLTYGCVTFFLFTLPLKLEALAYGIQFTGAVIGMLWLSFAAFSLVLQRYVDGPYLPSMLVGSATLIAVAFACMMLFGSPFFLFLSAALLGAGFACGNAPSTLLVLRLSPSRAATMAMSLDITFARFGAVCAVAVLAGSAVGITLIGVGLFCSLAIWLGLKATIDPEPALSSARSED